MSIEVRPATAADWPAVEAVMRTPGDPEECWCQVFRVPRDEWEARSVDQNRADLRRLVEDGIRPGLVAYLDGEPVGWCSLAPFEHFVRLAASPYIAQARPAGDDPAGRWAVVCFVVTLDARGQGVAEALLDAAVTTARSEGAAGLEAYAVDPARSEEPLTADDTFGGTVAMFQRAGFRQLADLGPRNALMLRTW